ncbi:MAG: hypothetical protein AAFZ63_13515 [Bacteroidota bacterium]
MRLLLQKRIAQGHHGKLWIADSSKEIDLVKLYGGIETYFADD